MGPALEIPDERTELLRRHVSRQRGETDEVYEPDGVPVVEPLISSRRRSPGPLDRLDGMASQKRTEQIPKMAVKQASSLVCLLGVDEFTATGLDMGRLDVLQKQRNRCFCDPGDRRPDDPQRRHGFVP